MLTDAVQRRHFRDSMFHGFDFDSTMLRVASRNLLLHGAENQDVRYRDSLAHNVGGDEDVYSLILANPPFAGSLDAESVSKELQRVVRTKKTELLFVALFLRLLKPGGRTAVIVPDGVLFGSSKAHKQVRRMLVEDHKLDAVARVVGRRACAQQPAGCGRPVGRARRQRAVPSAHAAELLRAEVRHHVPCCFPPADTTLTS